MRPASIRARLTAWYVAVLALAMVTLAGGGWWLLRESVVDAADRNLDARIDGVRAFIETTARELPPGDLQDEFQEFAQLTLGETLLEVTDAAGVTLCRPAMAGWDALRIADVSPRGVAVNLADRAVQGRRFRVAATVVRVQGRPYHVIAAIPMASADDAVTRLGWLLALLAPAVLSLAAVGGYWVSRRALAPVDRMARAAQAITLRNLDQRLDVPPADDELRRLALTFNDMLARLQAAVADMVRLTAEASHELRTPVTLVRATAEVALAMNRPSDEYRQALGEVLEHAERMSHLVGDLLVLARADAGVEPHEKTQLDLRDIAREGAHDVQAALRRKALVFDLRLPETSVEVEGQAESLHRLSLILLDNAVKYTPSGGAVRVAVGRAVNDDGQAVAQLEVEDTGVGITPADRPRVFDRFYRGEAARRQAADGSGLGLAIARTIVERCGGTIDLDPGPDGRGCRAVVRLPLAETAVAGAGPSGPPRAEDPGYASLGRHA